MDKVGRFVADAVLGIDTLWGGDVMCASGTGRFIADSWFSDEALPWAYTSPSAAKLREFGGVAGKNVDRDAVEQYLRDLDIPAAIAGMKHEAAAIGGLLLQFRHYHRLFLVEDLDQQRLRVQRADAPGRQVLRPEVAKVQSDDNGRLAVDRGR